MALWSSWTWGQKNHRGGFFLLKFLVKKAGISCGDSTYEMGAGRISL
jgi:hypothetical protein